RVGIGDTQVALANFTERGTREQCDASFIEQIIRDSIRITIQTGNIREHIECPGRFDTTDTGNGVQALDHRITPLVELLHHLVDWLLRTMQCGYPGVLDKSWRTGVAIDGQ